MRNKKENKDEKVEVEVKDEYIEENLDRDYCKSSNIQLFTFSPFLVI